MEASRITSLQSAASPVLVATTTNNIPKSPDGLDAQHCSPDMPRPRVPENKRRRTTRACDSCKRRKQKCDGNTPCSACQKKGVKCEYLHRRERRASRRATLPSPSTPKRHDTDESVDTPEEIPSKPPRNTIKKPHRSARSLGKRPVTQNDSVCCISETSLTCEGDDPSRQSTTSETDEEVEVVVQVRMLQDSRKRLFFMGDSSTLSYLQSIRMIVGNAAGLSSFTEDPDRHSILEPVASTPSTLIIPCILPERKFAGILVRSYFINTHGLIELFDHPSFYKDLVACYLDPLTASPSTLCLVYLVLAIGLAMATPAPNSPEESMIKQLREDPEDRAETLFRGAKRLTDPQNGIENADLWHIQAWTLMTVYMLVRSKPNVAYNYCGMAVRSAFSLGLHRISDTMVRFDNERVRRNTWRSLFVLDQFLAASLGRPCAICADDCSDDSLDSPVLLATVPEQAAEETYGSQSLDFSVKTSRSIDEILRKFYPKGKISTKLAQKTADACELWSTNVHPSLASEKLFNSTTLADKGIAILHIHLLHYHSIVLLGRPFFLSLFAKARPEKTNNRTPLHRTYSRSEKFSQACVAASTHSVALVQAAFDAKYLPRCNPFVLYFLFTAALTILSNEFAGLYENSHYATSISNAINITEYCAAMDVQAQRFLYVLEAFRSVVDEYSQSSNASREQDSFLPEGIITDPLQILDSRRQSTATRQALQPPTPAINTASYVVSQGSRDGEMSAQSTAQTPYFANAEMSPAIPRGEFVSPPTSRRASTQSSQHKADAESVETESAEAEFELDSEIFLDFQQGEDSDADGEYVHDSQPRPLSHGEQTAFQIHSGSYGTYPGHHGASSSTRAYAASMGVDFVVPFSSSINDGTSTG